MRHRDYPSCTAEGLLDSYVRLVISIRTSSGFESRELWGAYPEAYSSTGVRLSTRCVAVDMFYVRLAGMDIAP